MKQLLAAKAQLSQREFECAHHVISEIARVVAEAARIRAVLGWAPRHQDLDFIARTALEWERKLAAGGG